MIQIINKVWGEEHWIVNREYAGKKMVLYKGKQCSLHFHKIKDETFYVIKGKVLLEKNGERKILLPGDAELILPGEAHRFTGLGNSNSEIIEFSTHHYDEDDSDNFRIRPSKILERDKVLNPDVYITGNRGYLGRALDKRFRELGKKVYGSDIEFLDLLDKKKVFDELDEIQPKVIIHTASLSNWLTCESNPKLAKKINIDATKTLVEYCRTNNIPLVYISTDFIFNGKKGKYTENDILNSNNVYGKTKAKAEKIVETLKKYIIIRAGTFYGVSYYVDRPVFAHKLIRKITSGEEYKVANDEYSNPTLIQDIADVINGLINKNQNGIWNAGGETVLNKYDFALKIAEVFNLDKKLIKPTTISELDYHANRPRDVSLNMNKLNSVGIYTKNIEEGLIQMKKDFNEINKILLPLK